MTGWTIHFQLLCRHFHPSLSGGGGRTWWLPAFGVLSFLCSCSLAYLGFAEYKTVVIPKRPATADVSEFKIAVSPEVSDVGEVGQDETHFATFTITNPTPHPIHVRNVSKACSCSEAQLETKTLAPGATTRMGVSWKTLRASGVSSVPITLQYSCGKDGQVLMTSTVRIKGNVIPDYVVTPAAILFNKETHQAAVRITAGRKPIPKLLSATSSSPSVRADLKDDRVIAVLTDDSEVKDGQYILVETSDVMQNWLRIPIAVSRP